MAGRGAVGDKGADKDKAAGKSKTAAKHSIGAKQAHPKSPKAKAKMTTKRGWMLVLKLLLMLAWVGVSVIASQLIVGYLMLWMLGQETFLQPAPTAIYSALSYVLAMVLVIFVPPKVSVAWKIVNEKKDGKKTVNGKVIPRIASRETLGLKGWPTWTDIGLAPVGFIVYIILAAGLTAAFFGIFSQLDASQTQDVGFDTFIAGFDRVLAFITLVVVAPIAEEIIFRGWLYGKMREKLSERVSNVAGMAISILLVSLLFGLVHMQWNVGVNVFALSVVLCGLREITGTIYAGILLHMIKNGTAFYLLYVIGMA